MAALLDSYRNSDDGFQDFLSEDEEKETLLSQDSVALERRMKTVSFDRPRMGQGLSYFVFRIAFFICRILYFTCTILSIIINK